MSGQLGLSSSDNPFMSHVELLIRKTGEQLGPQRLNFEVFFSLQESY